MKIVSQMLQAMQHLLQSTTHLAPAHALDMAGDRPGRVWNGAEQKECPELVDRHLEDRCGEQTLPRTALSNSKTHYFLKVAFVVRYKNRVGMNSQKNTPPYLLSLVPAGLSALQKRQ